MSSNILRLQAGSSSRLSRRSSEVRDQFHTFITTKQCYELVWGQPPVYISAEDTVQIAQKVLARHHISCAPMQMLPSEGPSAVFNHRSIGLYLLDTFSRPSPIGRRHPQTGRPSSAMPPLNLRLMACSTFGPERPATTFASPEQYVALRQGEKLSVVVNHFKRNVSQVFVLNSRGTILGQITRADLLAQFVQKGISDIDTAFPETVDQRFSDSCRRSVNTICETVRHTPIFSSCRPSTFISLTFFILIVEL